MSIEDDAASKWWVFKTAAEQALSKQDYLSAEMNWLAALEEAEAFDHTDFTLLTTLERLAHVLYMQRKFPYAAPLMRRVLKAYQESLGPNHLDVAAAASNLAMLYHHWNKYSEAASFYHLALSIYMKASDISATEPKVVEMKANLADVLNEMAIRNIGQWVSSETSIRELGRADGAGGSNGNSAVRQELAPKAGDTTRTLGWKMILEGAIVGKNRSDFSSAEKMYAKALASAEDRNGPESVVVAYILLEFADFYFAQKQYEKAHDRYERAAKILSRQAHVSQR